jgi:hypothetical protein
MVQILLLTRLVPVAGAESKHVFLIFKHYNSKSALQVHKNFADYPAGQAGNEKNHMGYVSSAASSLRSTVCS